jgi:RHS repeat-associated protein
VIFVYGQQGELLGEYDHTGQVIREYAWLGNIPLAVFMPDPANPAGAPLVYYIHTDHLNTPRVVVDTNGATRWTWIAEPFGTTVPDSNPSGLGSFAFNLRFPGQYADAESGLFYNYFRNYDNSKGGYTQSDPIGLAGGINTYAYARADPLAFADPSGLYYFAIPNLYDQPDGWLVFHRDPGTPLTYVGSFKVLNTKCQILCVFTNEEWRAAMRRDHYAQNGEPVPARLSASAFCDKDYK